MEKTEIIISENGSITERTIKERELKVEDSVMDALTSEVFRTVRNVMVVPEWGVVHASVGINDTLWTVPIDRIPMRARFRVISGVLVPMFASSTELELPLVWRAPKEVRLAFVLQTEWVDERPEVTANYLFAYSADHNGYRLPLPNLHDDCMVCTGEFQRSHDSVYDCIAASLKQFNQSRWNADLMRTVEKSQKFFRFNPTNESFETLAIEAGDWTSLCDKVSTATLERVVL